MARPRIPDIHTLMQAGFDPKTGLPVRFGGSRCSTKEDIKKALRIIDEQDACNRYVWKNIPANITSQELERMIYYKGQLCMFYDKTLEEYYVMPYALDGTIDFYGRYNTVHPVPMTSGTEDKGNKAVAELLSTIKLKCIYDEKQIEKFKDQECCVLIHDYTKQLSQTILPRVTVNEPILDVMSEYIPFMRTALLAATGVKGVRVNDADQQASVMEGSMSLLDAALKGDPWVPVIGGIEFQELTGGTVAKAEEYMMAMQSVDNFRLSTYGIQSGGVFEKKAHVLESEEEINEGPVDLVMKDGLEIRQHFCELANKMWGLDMSVEQANIGQKAEEDAPEMEEEMPNYDEEETVNE